MEVLVLFRRKAPSHWNMEKLPFPGEGLHIENRRLGSLFEDRRIRPKKNLEKKNPRKNPLKKPEKNPQQLEFWEQKIEIPSIQAYMCLYRDTGKYVPVSHHPMQV